MKLLACHIENFGKLSDLKLEFADGLNVINEANAWGKSTLAAFLKAMFYGLDAKKATGAFEKERVVYRPWQGGAFGGEVDFEVNGKMYRVSRTFGRTEKSDEFHLYDLKTNLECFDFSEDIGSELFELDSASFKRSVYIAQNDCVSEPSDGINAKLGNLAENTDDINNFDSANRYLKDVLNQLTPDRVTGSIKKRKNYITQLTQELRTFESAQEGLDGIKNKEQSVAVQIQELSAVRKQYADALVMASEDSRRKTLYAQYDALCQEVEEKEQNRDKYKKIFPVGVPAEAEFQTQMQNVAKMHEAQTTARGYELSIEELEEYSKLQEMFETNVPTEEEIDETLAVFAEIDKKKEEIARQESKLSVYHTDLEQEAIEPKFSGSLAYRIFLSVGIGFALAGLGALVVWLYKLLPQVEPQYLLIAAIIAGICGTVFGVVGSVLGIRVYKDRQTWETMIQAEKTNIEGKANTLLESINGLKDEVRKMNSAIGKFLGDYHVYCEVGEYQPKLYELKTQMQDFLRMKEKKELANREMECYKEYRGKMLNFAKMYQFSFSEDCVTELNFLQTKAAEYQMADKAFQEISAKKRAFEQAQDKQFWTKQALCPYSLDELNSLITQTDEKLEGYKTARNQYVKQLEDLQEQLDLRDEKEIELRDMCQQQEKDMQKYHILKLTQEYLQTAKEQFTARYMDPISEGFAKYYSLLTGDVSDSWVIDANITLRLRQMGELRDVHWLSAGYQDLIGVCMRLALVDAMYQEEKPFLILDDPFVNLDQEKVQAGNELLMEVAEEYQIIYFTCHDSRCPSV